MKRGKINIEYSSTQNDVKVELELVDETIWLTAHEIADTFNVFISAVTSNLRVIEKNDEAFFNENTSELKFTKKGVTYYSTLYNLDIIMELVFRSSSDLCKLFRTWVRNNIKESLSKANKQTILLDISKLHSIGSESPIS